MSFIRDLLFLQGFPTEPLFGPVRSTRPAPMAGRTAQPAPGAGPRAKPCDAEREPRSHAARAA